MGDGMKDAVRGELTKMFNSMDLDDDPPVTPPVRARGSVSPQKDVLFERLFESETVSGDAAAAAPSPSMEDIFGEETMNDAEPAAGPAASKNAKRSPEQTSSLSELASVKKAKLDPKETQTAPKVEVQEAAAAVTPFVPEVASSKQGEVPPTDLKAPSGKAETASLNQGDVQPKETEASPKEAPGGPVQEGERLTSGPSGNAETALLNQGDVQPKEAEAPPKEVPGGPVQEGERPINGPSGNAETALPKQGEARRETSVPKELKSGDSKDILAETDVEAEPSVLPVMKRPAAGKAVRLRPASNVAPASEPRSEKEAPPPEDGSAAPPSESAAPKPEVLVGLNPLDFVTVANHSKTIMIYYIQYYILYILLTMFYFL